MKKFLLIAAMFLSLSAHAESNETPKADVISNGVKKYELVINRRRLACVLDMDANQMEMTDKVLYELEKDMSFASSMETEESGNKVVANAAKKNLKYMHYILNSEQFNKYRMLLNLTLINKGFIFAETSENQ